MAELEGRMGTLRVRDLAGHAMCAACPSAHAAIACLLLQKFSGIS